MKPAESSLILPSREKKFRNLKEAMRHGIYSRPGGKNAETLAMEAGLDRLSDLSRYVGDNPNDPRGRFLDIFIPLLIAMEEKGVEVHAYIGEEIRAARDRAEKKEREDNKVAAEQFFAEHSEELMKYIKVMAAKR